MRYFTEHRYRRDAFYAQVLPLLPVVLVVIVLVLELVLVLAALTYSPCTTMWMPRSPSTDTGWTPFTPRYD